MFTTIAPSALGVMPPNGPYVLLVDDHLPSLRRLQEVVKHAGHRCVSVSSATSALRLLEIRRPQVVVTDLDMPNLDGFGLARWVKARCPSVAIVLVTGSNLDVAEVDSLSETFTGVFSKPIDVDSFLDRLDRLMPVD